MDRTKGIRFPPLQVQQVSRLSPLPSRLAEGPAPRSPVSLESSSENLPRVRCVWLPTLPPPPRLHKDRASPQDLRPHTQLYRTPAPAAAKKTRHPTSEEHPSE